MLRDAEAAATKLGMARVVERAREVAGKISGDAAVLPSAESTAESIVSPGDQLLETARGTGDSETIVFRREGEYWTIAQGDTVSRLKDVKGLRYIAHLLRNPSTDFHVLEIVSACEESRSGSSDRPMAATGAEPIFDQDGPGALLDDTAKSQYRSRLAGLREQLEEAESLHDIGHADAIRAEIDQLVKALSEAIGLGGRDRHVRSSAERARWTVTKGIKSAVGKIQKDNPFLGRHLATRIRTGHVCRYDPDPDRPIRWIL
jgi:hypothetical protein